MFVGHLAVGLASKRLAPTTSLVWFITAASFVDLIWPIFLLTGIEHARIEPGATAFTPLVFESYPWTHSLLMGAVWGLVLGGLARGAGVAARASWLIAAGVLSHWVLDLVTHAPDLTLWPGEQNGHGWGLWDSIPATLAVEGAIWITAIVVYLRTRRANGWAGHLAFWSFVAVSTILWASGPFAPPPPDERSLGWGAAIGWIIVPWAWWIERSSSGRDTLRDGRG